MMNLKDFIYEQQIEEALRPRPVSYGTNYPSFTDRKWINFKLFGTDLESTVFESSDRWCVVDVTKGSKNFIFRTYPKVSGIDSLDEILKSARYDKSKHFNSDADVIRLLKNVIYIMFEKAKTLDWFEFSSRQNDLIRVYTRMVNSNAFKEEIDKIGFGLGELETSNSGFKVRFNRK